MWLREMYDNAMDGVMSRLLTASAPTGLAFLGKIQHIDAAFDASFRTLSTYHILSTHFITTLCQR